MREGDLIWEPSGPSKLTDFMRERGFSAYDELWRWSVEDLEGFWGSIWDAMKVGPAPERVLGRSQMPGAEWFPGTTLNYAERLFRRARPGATAIVHSTESSPVAEMTWDEPLDATARARRACGVSASRTATGCGVHANVPETVIAFLACASIGAIWSVLAGLRR